MDGSNLKELVSCLEQSGVIVTHYDGVLYFDSEISLLIPNYKKYTGDPVDLVNLISNVEGVEA